MECGSEGAHGAENQGGMKPRSGWALITAALLVASAPAGANGEHARRLQVELAVMQGDTKLLVDPATPPLRRQGLRQRIRSSLGTLGMLARYAAQEDRGRQPVPTKEIASLRALFAAGNMLAFARRLDRIQAGQPLELSGFLPLTASPARLRTGQSIYQRLCIGCHQNPDRTQPNPAPDLFSMAAVMPHAEFIARMLGGIHGDRTTTLQNPFSDEEIASLTAFFRSEQKGGTAAPP